MLVAGFAGEGVGAVVAVDYCVGTNVATCAVLIGHANRFVGVAAFDVSAPTTFLRILILFVLVLTGSCRYC